MKYQTIDSDATAHNVATDKATIIGIIVSYPAAYPNMFVDVTSPAIAASLTPSGEIVLVSGSIYPNY